MAISIAAESKRKAKSQNRELNESERLIAESTAEDSFQELSSSCGDDKEALAAAIYKPLYLKQASKAETAELLAAQLSSDKRTHSEMRAVIPKYIVDAIDYVTRSGEDAG